MIELYDYQKEAVERLKNGSILCGGVGSGKSRTALYYYFLQNGGGISAVNRTTIPMKDPKDLYIITTAKKRDSLEWEGELAYFNLSTKSGCGLYKNLVVIDSWNNIKKHSGVFGAFFILDEQRLTGNGAWVKAFLKIAKKNEWIMLSATPGDTFLDYIPVFIANGFYKNRTEFMREHVIFARFSKYPKVDRYIGVAKLIRERDSVLVNMDYERKSEHHDIKVLCDYDKMKYKEVFRTRFDPYKNEPIPQASVMCYILRRIVNEDESRVVNLLEILEKHPRAIIFYNFDYELEALKHVFWDHDEQDWLFAEEENGYFDDFELAEWNGHRHEPLPKGEKWIYLVNYAAGAEGWNAITTDTIIFYSANYSYKVMTQAAGRIDRLNSPYKDLYYYHFTSNSSIDLAINRALSKKKAFNEGRFVKW